MNKVTNDSRSHATDMRRRRSLALPADKNTRRAAMWSSVHWFAVSTSVGALLCMTWLISSGCQDSQPSRNSCAEAIDGVASLVVENASAGADREAHTRNIARALAPSLTERCERLSKKAQGAFSDCVSSAESLSELKSCETASFSNGHAKGDKNES